MKIYFYIELYRAQAQSNFQAQAIVCTSSFELFSLAFLFVDNEIFLFFFILMKPTLIKRNSSTTKILYVWRSYPSRAECSTYCCKSENWTRRVAQMRTN